MAPAGHRPERGSYRRDGHRFRTGRRRGGLPDPSARTLRPQGQLWPCAAHCRFAGHGGGFHPVGAGMPALGRGAADGARAVLQQLHGADVRTRGHDRAGLQRDALLRADRYGRLSGRGYRSRPGTRPTDGGRRAGTDWDATHRRWTPCWNRFVPARRRWSSTPMR